MSKITLTDLANLQNETTAVNAINTNNAVLTTALTNTLSRDGTSPNQMGAILDMNSHSIINLPIATSGTEPATKAQLDAIGNGYLGNNILVGTNNEINVSSGGGTSTFGLPTSLTFTGKTVTGGTFASTTLSGTPNTTTSKYIADGAQIINASDHGVGTGVADNGVPLQALITSLASTGGVINLPFGTLSFTTQVSLSNKTAIILNGKTGVTAGASFGTVLLFSGLGATDAITMSGSTGCRLQNLTIATADVSMIGSLVSGGTTNALNFFENCLFFGTKGSGINLDSCIENHFKNCVINGFARGSVVGKTSDSSFSNVMSFTNCQFTALDLSLGGAYVQQPDNAWKFDTCTFEAVPGSFAGIVNVSTTFKGLSFLNCWFGDVTTGAAAWMDLKGHGLNVQGCYFGGNASSTAIILESGSDGIVVKGNYFDGFNIAISASNCSFVDFEPNYFINCTNKILAAGLASPGYHVLPNGMLMEYGNSVVTIGTPLTITLPKALTAAPISIQLTEKDATGQANIVFATNVTSTTFQISVLGVAGTETVYWTAIGNAH